MHSSSDQLVSSRLNIVFFGTPPFAAKVLHALFQQKDKGFEIRAVVTQPDRGRGREQKVVPSAVKQKAIELLPLEKILQPEKAKDPLFLEELAAIKADLFIVVAYGQILSSKLLSIPPLGSINVHTSVLPKYRGAAPIQRAIMAGEKKTGVTIMQIVEKLDAGPIYKIVEVEIPEEMNCAELEEKLLEKSTSALLDVLATIQQGKAVLVEQNDLEATYAAKIQPEELEIDFSKTAKEIYNTIRAFSPKPGAFFYLLVQGEKRRIKLLRAAIVDRSGPPGHILQKDSEGWIVACGAGALKLLELQSEGKRPMDISQWSLGIRGHIEIFLKNQQ